jgi:hypothetical protein
MRSTCIRDAKALFWCVFIIVKLREGSKRERENTATQENFHLCVFFVFTLVEHQSDSHQTDPVNLLNKEANKNILCAC